MTSLWPSTHIIIADNEEPVRRLLKTMMEKLFPAYSISTTNNGAKALHLFEKCGADLIITACEMPGISGLEFVQVVRATRFTLPIVMISGQRDAERLSYEAGATLFLEKANLRQQLPGVLSRLLSR